MFDISDPCNPQEIQTNLFVPEYKQLDGHENLVWVKDFTDYSYKIFDITNPANPILRNTIPVGDWHQISWSYLRFDGYNTDEVYLFCLDPTIIKNMIFLSREVLNYYLIILQI